MKQLRVSKYRLTLRTDYNRLKRGCRFLNTYEIHTEHGERYGHTTGFAFWWLDIENVSLKIHPLCSECNSPDIAEMHMGDEGWTVCRSCRSVEQGYVYVDLETYENALIAEIENAG